MRDTSQYSVDGVRVPSVTEILHLAGLVDYRNVAPGVLERAAIRGQELHHWVDVLERGGTPKPEEPAVVGRLEAYQKFRETQIFRRTSGETAVVSQLYRFAGTPDYVGTVGLDECPVVIDVKPPGVVQPWWPLQVEGYALALEETLQVPRVKGFVLQLSNDGRFKVSPPGGTSRDARHDFQAALRCTHFRLRHGMARLQ